MSELSQLLDDTAMSLRDFSYALGVRNTSIERMLRGDIPTPAGVISDAHQLLADIDYVEAALQANPALAEINYKVFKLLLANNVEQD